MDINLRLEKITKLFFFYGGVYKMEQIKISHDCLIELERSGKLYQFSPAFWHTQLHSGLFAYSPQRRNM